MNDKVTIVIPCYNVEDHIVECIDSSLNQTYKNVEIICIDNNSKDKTLHILNDISLKYSQKIRVFSEKKPGASAARNRGLNKATSDWIQFLDADDLLLPEKIEHQMKLIKSHNANRGFVAASWNKYLLNGKEIYEEVDPFNDVYKSLFNKKLGITSSNLWNREYLIQVGKWNENLVSSQEPDLMFRLIKDSYLPVIDNKSLTIIRQRASGQISHMNPVKKWQNYLNLRLQIFSYLEEHHLKYFNLNKEFYLNSLFNIIRTITKFDIIEGEKLFNDILGKNFIPNNKFSGASNIYIILLRLLNFRKAEKLRSIIKKF